jgi:hypothetical protein
MTQRTAARTADLLDTFGVVTHIPATDGGYRELGATTNALRYLGIDHVRDAAPNPAYDSYGQRHIAEAAAQGIHFTFTAEGGVDPVVTVQRIHAIELAYPGTVTAIEGPNEVNNWPVTYGGLSGTAGAQAYMRALFDAVQADPLLRDITVTGFTDWPNHASKSDTSTIHPYVKNGDQPLGRIWQDMQDQNAVDPGKRFLITETGYHTRINPSSGWEGVDEATQAKLLLNTYMDGALLGAQQTYVYQLLDAYAGNSQEEHFGLFRLDNSPKPAATAIHNLTTILKDTGGGAETFATGSLDLTVTGGGHSYLTGKSDGSYQVIVWAEPDIWDEARNQPITVAPIMKTIDFGQTVATVQVFDPLLGTSAIRTLRDVSSVTLGVTDHPLIVQLFGATATFDASADHVTIFRFLNTATGTHFYTASAAERDDVRDHNPRYQYEGPAFAGTNAADADISVFRFFNRATGTHFYTGSAAEADNVMKTLPNYAYEGIAYRAFSQATDADGDLHKALYRFYNTQAGVHFYTANPNEKASIEANLPSFKYEGVAYYVDAVL